MSDLANFFSPRSIAVIGATEGVEKIGGRLMSNLLRHGYAGGLYPINHNRREIHGLTAYPDLAALPERVDLALICIPAAAVPGALEACAAAGIRNVVVTSSGFADIGESGMAVERETIALGRRLGLRLAGPNTQGFFNVPACIAATFSPAVGIDPGPKGPRRRIAVVAQSGGMGFALYNRGRIEGLDFSTVVSVGNQGDLEIADYADALLDDDETKTILLFIEAIKTPARFLALAAKAARLGKPLIVAKIGRFKGAKRAVASHTGSLAGSDAAYDAIFAQYGVIRAENPDEMVEIAALFTRHQLPRGNRLAILSATGGIAAWLADICEAAGFELPEIDAERQQRLREVIPPYGSPRNPVDITAQGLTGYARSLAIIADQPDLDAIIIAISLAQDVRLAREGEAIAELARTSGKPILLFAYTVASEASKALLAGWDLHCYNRMAGCARALQAGIEYWQFQEACRAAGVSADVAPIAASDTVARYLAQRDHILCEYEAAELLAAYGIASLPSRLALSATEAVAAAEAVGWPVALKVQSPQIPHKSDAQGVALGIADEAALRRDYARILAAARAYAPAAEIRGVLVQAMAKPGIELIAGMVNDLQFGPLLMCGIGGIHAEIFADVAFAPVPLSRTGAGRLLDRLKGARLLAATRGAAPADRAAVIDLLLRLSQLASDGSRQIAEIDLNPIILYPQGQGLALVDALIVQKEASP